MGRQGQESGVNIPDDILRAYALAKRCCPECDGKGFIVLRNRMTGLISRAPCPLGCSYIEHVKAAR